MSINSVWFLFKNMIELSIIGDRTIPQPKGKFMDLTKLSSLKIIKSSQDPLARANGSNIDIKPQPSAIKTPSEGPISIIEKINTNYAELRKGKLNQADFNRKILQIDKDLLSPLNTLELNNIKIEILNFLFATLKWYIQLKFLLSTGLKAETLSDINKLPTKYKELSDYIKFIDNLDNQSERQKVNPKDISYKIKGLLEIFIKDDIIYPKYKINNEMIMYLSNQRPTFLNEITVLFDLYSKYYDQISNDFLEKRTLRNIKDIQPRFDMINRHILSSNLSTRVDYDIDLSSISDGGLNISTSRIGLEKRLTHLNSWLMNGIIHTQSSINRFSALKPVTKNTYRGFSDLNNQPIDTKYQLWMIMRDTKAFLESLKGLVDGTAFITGMQSGDILDVLEVNY